jgi:hypothetical protein
MNRLVSAVANRLSLRVPALENLDLITELGSLKKGADTDAAMAPLKAEYPESDCERVSFGRSAFVDVGNTWLMAPLSANW